MRLSEKCKSLCDESEVNLYAIGGETTEVSIETIGHIIIKMKETIALLTKEWREANRNEEGEKI